MTHGAVGVAAGIVIGPRRPPLAFWIVWAALPMVPDLDVLGLLFGIPFHSMWGHRGITHSLAVAVALGVVTAALTTRPCRMRALPLAVYLTAITASHGVLDALTNGGIGVAFFAPFDDARHFFPWRPIPVSPLGMHFFSEWGGQVFLAEIAMIWLPAALIAAIARAGRRARAR